MRASGIAVAVGIALALGGAGWLHWQSTASRDGEVGEQSAREAQAARRDGPELAGRRAAHAKDAALDEGRFEIPGVVEDEEGRALAGLVVEARFRRPLPDPAEESAAPESLFGPEFGLNEPLGEETQYATVTSLADGTFALVVRRRGDFALIAAPEPPLVGLEQEVTVDRERHERVTLRVANGSALKGRVVDAAERGIDAILWAMWDGELGSWHPAAIATAAGSGAFAFAAVPAGEITLRVLLPGRLKFDVQTTTPRAEEWVIRLGAFAPLLAGTVRDVEGRPIAGARVGVSLAAAPSSPSSSDPECLAVTDADGRYRIEGPFAGPVLKVRAEATGFLPLEQEPPVPRWSGLALAPGREATLDLTLWRGGTLTGAVRERGSQTPLAGAVVSVVPLAVDGRMGSASHRRAVSDTQGRYTVLGVPVGRSVLIVHHATHYFPPLESLPHRTAGGNELDLDDNALPDPPPTMTLFLAREGERLVRDIELERGLEVAGQVVDASGAPVADAEVHALSLEPRFAGDGDVYVPDRPTLGRSTADGRFLATGLPPRPDWTLYATKSGFLGEPAAPFPLSASARAPDVTLRLLAGATIVGRVVDAFGNGCPNVGVNAWTNDDSGFFGGEASQAVSGPDGAFRLEHVTPGKVELSATSATLGAGSTTVEDVGVGEVREGVVISLAPHVSVIGVLVDEQGRAVRDKSLTATSSARGATHYFSSDRQGRFHFWVDTPGEYQVYAQGNHDTELARITAPAEDARVVWKEPPPSLVVEGLVTDAAGRAVPLCHVAVNAEAAGGGNACGGGGNACGGGSSRNEGSAVVQGWFRQQVDGAAPLQVKVTDARDGEGHRLNLKDKAVTLAEAPAGSVTIALEAGLEVSGRVLDGAGGPLAGVAVRAGEVRSTTDGDGAFRLGGLAGESVTLSCHPVPPWITPGEQVVAVGGEEVVFRLKQGLAIAGRVVDTRGRPLNEVWIEASWPESEGGPPGSAEVGGLGREGRFRFQGIPESALVTLEVHPWDGEQRMRRVGDIRPGTEDLVIEFGGGVAVEGLVVDAQGRPFSDATVEVRLHAEDEEGVRISVQDDGTFRAAGLTPGPVWISVRRDGGGPGTDPIRVEAPATKIRIALPATAPLYGRLVGAGGEKFRVWAWQVERPDQTARARTVGADGQFEIEGAGLAGTWMVAARAHPAGDRYALAGPVPAGSRDVVLELRTGRSVEGVATLPSGSAAPKSTWITIEAEAGSWNAWTRPDATGRFAFRGLPPGRYKIGAWYEALSAQRDGVADGTHDVKLALAPNTDDG